MTYPRRLSVALFTLLASASAAGASAGSSPLPPPLAKRVAASIRYADRHINILEHAHGLRSFRKSMIGALVQSKKFLEHISSDRLRRPKCFLAIAVIKPTGSDAIPWPRGYLGMYWACAAPSANAVLIFAHGAAKWELPISRSMMRHLAKEGTRRCTYALSLSLNPRGQAGGGRASATRGARPGPVGSEPTVLENILGHWRPESGATMTTYISKHAGGHFNAALAEDTKPVSNRVPLIINVFSVAVHKSGSDGKRGELNLPPSQSSVLGARKPGIRQRGAKSSVGGNEQPAASRTRPPTKLRELTREVTLPFLKNTISGLEGRRKRLERKLALEKAAGAKGGAAPGGKTTAMLAACRDAIVQWRRALHFFRHLKSGELQKPTLLCASARILNFDPKMGPPIVFIRVYYASRPPIRPNEFSLTVFRRGRALSVIVEKAVRANPAYTRLIRKKFPKSRYVGPSYAESLPLLGPYLHQLNFTVAKGWPPNSINGFPGMSAYYANFPQDRRLVDFVQRRRGGRIQLGLAVKGKLVGRKLYASVSQLPP